MSNLLQKSLATFDIAKFIFKPFLELKEDLDSIGNGTKDQQIKAAIHLFVTSGILIAGGSLPLFIPSLNTFLSSFVSSLSLPSWITSYFGNVYVSAWFLGYPGSYVTKQILRGITLCLNKDDPDYPLINWDLNYATKNIYLRLKDIEGLENLTKCHVQELVKEFHSWMVNKIKDNSETKILSKSRLISTRRKLLKGYIDKELLGFYAKMEKEYKSQEKDIINMLKHLTHCDEVNPSDSNGVNNEKKINLEDVKQKIINLIKGDKKVTNEKLIEKFNKIEKDITREAKVILSSIEDNEKNDKKNDLDDFNKKIDKLADVIIEKHNLLSKSNKKYARESDSYALNMKDIMKRESLKENKVKKNEKEEMILY